jgi:transketolase
VVLLASGSEVSIALEAREILQNQGVPARVVSFPSHEKFAQQPDDYRREVLLGPGVVKVAVEAAHPMSWYRWIGENGAVIGLERFGASAPYGRLYHEFGLTAARVAAVARQLLEERSGLA